MDATKKVAAKAEALVARMGLVEGAELAWGMASRNGKLPLRERVFWTEVARTITRGDVELQDRQTQHLP